MCAPDGIRTRAAGLKDEQELPSDLRFYSRKHYLTSAFSVHWLPRVSGDFR